tara:strand:- start:86 stop:1795 length:1710 start_codon:yes stop_codon:yes gene_type:complete
MDNSLLILIFWYLLIPTSIIGFGLILQKIFYSETLVYNFGYAGIFGICFLIIYSYLTNFFFAHSKVHNVFFLIAGLLLFIYFTFNSKNKNFNNQIILLFSNLLILFIGLIIFKNHDDFIYYHFPYTYLLTQNELIIGLGNLGHGFRTQSSLFYLNSLFYLPQAEYFLFNLGAILILCFSNLILLQNIFGSIDLKKKKQDYNFYKYLSLFIFVFINIFFYRIAEHGTDRSAQILVFILFIEMIYFLNIYKINTKNFIHLFLILSLIISFKAFYLLYLILLFPIFFHLFQTEKKLKKIKNTLINQKFLIFFTLLVSLVIFKNFLNTGCFVYPVYFTCFENLSWSIPIDEVKKMNNWYELWSKAGAGPNFRIDNPENYIQFFNWVENWGKIYFFNKVSDLFLGLFLMCLILFIFFYKSSLKKNRFKKIINLKYIYLVILLLFFEWFYNHPALRYGGYSLIVLLIAIPVSNYLYSKQIQLNVFLKRAKIIVLITFIVFFGRNFDRINNEYNKYSFNPFKNSFYDTSEKNFRVEKKINKILERNMACKNEIDKNKCLEKINKSSKKFNFIVIEN